MGGFEGGHITHLEYYKCRNFNKIAQKADEIYHQHCDSSTEITDKTDKENIGIDWFVRFFKDAENISDEDMQDLWAKVLAGEIKQPGIFCALIKQSLTFRLWVCKFILIMSKTVAPYHHQTVWLDIFGEEICVVSGRVASDPTILKWIKQHFETGQAASDMQANFTVQHCSRSKVGFVNLFECINGRDNVVTDIIFYQGLITIIDGMVRLQVKKLLDYITKT